MHIPNRISVAEDPNTEGIKNIITNVFQVVLLDSPLIPPHTFPQLEPKLFLKVDAFIKYQVIMPVISNTVIRRPRP